MSSSDLIAGRYRIISQLGEGGMGVVYRVWDNEHDVPVVVKMPKADKLSDQDFIERFNREIKAMAGLAHPHIVPIVGNGQDETGRPYVAMRFLPGGSLSDRRRRGPDKKPLPNHPSLLHHWLPAIADALDFVHRSGLVHRDVKPDNIFFDARWNAFLGDFGVAKVLESGGVVEKDATMTATGMAVGTHAYMAPEVFSNRPVAASDQYSLAITVYELLAGTRPFTGESSHIIAEHLTMPVPPLKDKQPQLPARLCEAVHRALSKKPEDRFETCGEFAAAVLKGVPVPSAKDGVTRVMCPACRVMLDLNEKVAGKIGTCRQCNAPMRVSTDLEAVWLLSENTAQQGEEDRRASKTPSTFGTTPQPSSNGFPGKTLPVGIRLDVKGAIIAAAAVIILVSGWLWIRSSLRAAAHAAAIKSEQWDDVLAIDPGSVLAYDGRARLRLALNPPDIDGAFEDIASAEKLIGGPEVVKPTRVAGHAARALALARSDKLADAALDVAEAVRLGGDQPALAPAKAAIISAWLARADKAIDKRDKVGLQIACRAAAQVGASDDTLATLWRQYAVKCIEQTDATGLQAAVAEAKKRGVATAEVAALWLQYGYHGVTIRDIDAIRKACEVVSKLDAKSEEVSAHLPNACPRSPLGLWCLCAEGCVDRLDKSGLKIACAQAEKFNFPSSDVAAMWLRYANTGFKKSDWESVLLGCDEAANAGASEEILNALRAQGMVMKAQDMFDRGETGQAVEVAIALVSAKSTAASAMLKQVAFNSLREAVLNECRRRIQLRTDVIPVAYCEMLQTLGGPRELLPAVRNSIGIELKLIPAGTYTRRNPYGPNEKPHEVTLAQPFYIGIYEVTNAQWFHVMGVGSQHDDRPVDNVNYKDAVEFCLKLSALPDERAAGRLYRLPTEAEWEYACRAGTTTNFSFGNKVQLLGDHGWFSENSRREPHPVGQKAPNAWGLCDMHGNASEWCSDWYEDYPDGDVTNPQGPSSGSSRVYRGGSWSRTAGNCRSAFRGRGSPLFRDDSLGFRVALSPSESKPPEVDNTEDAAARLKESERMRVTGESEAKPAVPLQGLLRNSIDVQMKLIPAGTFRMGDAGGDSDENPRIVTLTKPFYIGIHEVTNAQWFRVMGGAGSQHDNRPVDDVKYNDAVEFCRKLSALPEEQAAGRVYRLPTEAEWEYACRAGTTTKFSCGDSENRLGEHAWIAGNSGGETHAVGQKKPNEWGLYDMHGNVLEWCSDAYEFSYPVEMVTDPEVKSRYRGGGLRGGCCRYSAERCRSADRFQDNFSPKGLRLAMSPSLAESPETGK